LLIDLRGQILDVLSDEQKPKFEDKIDEIRRGGGLRPRASRAAPASAEAPKPPAQPPAREAVEPTDAATNTSRAMAPPGSSKFGRGKRRRRSRWSGSTGATCSSRLTTGRSS
jgi:hypothetical protein